MRRALPRTVVALAGLWPVVALLAATTARAQEDGPARVRVRQATVVRWAPRWVLTADESAAAADAVFWRRADELPLYDRVALDGEALVDGHVDVHLSAWGALDLTVDTEAGLAAGDVATAWARGRYGPVAAWGGRRFVPWGLPGGIHVDGVGAEVRSPGGVLAEAVVGRPVTPRQRTLLGARPSFDGATIAYGARVGHAEPRSHAAALSYVERWADGIAADRSVSVDGYARIASDLDADATVQLEARDASVEQARTEVLWITDRHVTLDAAYAYTDPRRLLPSWSILSVFVTRAYDEVSTASTVRPTRRLTLRTEVALRSYRPIDDQDEEAGFGYRLDAVARGHVDRRRTSWRLGGSRRTDGFDGWWVFRGAVARTWSSRITSGFETAVAFDDELGRDSMLARATLDLALADGLTVGGGLDVVRSPIAEAELRGLVRLSWRERAEVSR